MKKKVSLLMATLMVGSTLMATGCFGETSEVVIDKTKTQLFIANLDVGIGRSWVDALSKKFEDAFKTYSFEDGKVGVQIIPDHDTRFSGEFAEQCNTDMNYIYFTESVDYAMHSKYMEDITDVMEQGAITGVDENGELTRESTPISQKIDPFFYDYLNRGTDAEPSYRAMPYYLGMRVVNYDMDLWSDNQLYLAKKLAPSEIVVQELLKEEPNEAAAIASYNAEIAKLQKGEKSNYWRFVNKDGKYKVGNQEVELGLSAGPDGKYGTFDDGLPATYDEFYLLCEKMVGAGITPFIWTGASPNYAENLTRSLFQNDAGVDALKTFYSLEGTVDNLVKLDSNGKVVMKDGKPELESYTFTGGQDDGYNIFRMDSLYNALQFVNKVIDNRTWTDTACFDRTSMVQAQAKYLTQGHTGDGKPIAMILEGSWWQQEATPTFTVMEKVDKKYAKQNRNFSVMSLPNSSIERTIERIKNDEKMTFVTANDSFMYINGKLEEGTPELAVTKAFLSFISNDDCILTFMELTNMLRPLTPNYEEVDEERYNDLSAYTKRLVEIQKNANVVYPYSKSKFSQENSSLWSTFTTFPNATIGQHTYPIQAMRTQKEKGLNAKVCFEGVYRYFKTVEWPKVNK